MRVIKRSVPAAVLCWATIAFSAPTESPASQDEVGFGREFNTVADAVAEAISSADPSITSVPVIGTYSLDFDGSLGQFEQILLRIPLIDGFDPMLCVGTAYEHLSQSEGCDYALLVEGLRRVQSKHGVKEAIARAITWIDDIMYFPSENSCFSMARPRVDSLEIEVNGLYRLAWYSRECSENSVFLRGEGLLDLTGSGCKSYAPRLSNSQSTLQALSNCIRVHIPKRVITE